jgi:hypothetical protein
MISGHSEETTPRSHTHWGVVTEPDGGPLWRVLLGSKPPDRTANRSRRIRPSCNHSTIALAMGPRR